MFDRIFKVNIWDDVFLSQESCLKASQRISCPDSEIASWHGINGRISVLFSSFFYLRIDKLIPIFTLVFSIVLIFISHLSFSLSLSLFLSFTFTFYSQRLCGFTFKLIVWWKDYLQVDSFQINSYWIIFIQSYIFIHYWKGNL